jgi:hypothetical protein
MYIALRIIVALRVDDLFFSIEKCDIMNQTGDIEWVIDCCLTPYE